MREGESTIKTATKKEIAAALAKIRQPKVKRERTLCISCNRQLTNPTARKRGYCTTACQIAHYRKKLNEQDQELRQLEAKIAGLETEIKHLQAIQPLLA